MGIVRNAVLLSAAMLVAASVAVAGERLALVSSEGENSVAIVDLNTEKTVKVLPVGRVPHAMAAAPSGKIFVNNRGSKDLSVIDAGKDAGRMEVVATIPLPATSFQLGLSPDGKTLAVVYKDALKLTLVDVATNAIVRTVDIGTSPAAFKGAMMKHPYWSADNRYVYCPESVSKTIVKVEAASGAVLARIALPGGNHYMHPSPDGTLIYAVNEATKDGSSLTLIDPATDTVVVDLPLSLAAGDKGEGHHSTFSPDNRFYFFTNTGSSGLHVLDVARRAWVKVIRTGKGPGHPSMSPDGTRIFVVHHKDGVISVIDVERQEFVKDIKIGLGSKQAHASYFSPDGRYFYAVAAADNLLVKIDVSTMTVASTMPVPKSSMFFAIKEGNSFPSTE